MARAGDGDVWAQKVIQVGWRRGISYECTGAKSIRSEYAAREKDRLRNLNSV